MVMNPAGRDKYEYEYQIGFTEITAPGQNVIFLLKNIVSNSNQYFWPNQLVFREIKL